MGGKKTTQSLCQCVFRSFWAENEVEIVGVIVSFHFYFYFHPNLICAEASQHAAFKSHSIQRVDVEFVCEKKHFHKS